MPSIGCIQLGHRDWAVVTLEADFLRVVFFLYETVKSSDEFCLAVSYSVLPVLIISSVHRRKDSGRRLGNHMRSGR